MGDVLNEKEDTSHIDYFQGHRQFRELGLPRELPAEVKEAILAFPELVVIRSRIQELIEKGEFEAVEYERLQHKKKLVRLRLSELHRYQAQWVRERRDRRIVNREKEDPDTLESNACTDALAQIMPELGCIAATLASGKPLSFDEKLLFAEQLLIQCRRDYDVIYLPDEAPIDGECPVRTCRANVQKWVTI